MPKVEFDIPIAPKSKARPRSFQGQARPYMDPSYKKWKKDVWSLASEFWTEKPLEKCNAIIVVFYGPARGDIDNLIGGLLDALVSVKEKGKQPYEPRLFKDDNVKVINDIHMRWMHEPKAAKAHIHFMVYY
tara:strand:- start:460 stop:852 length:393 start_codon:yes stop_codon:yes gene_type:complete